MLRAAHPCFVTELPSDLIGDILGRWLDIKSISRLDCALCTGTARAALLDLFTSKPFSTNDSVHIHSVELMQWLLARRIVLPEIQLLDSFPELPEYLGLYADKIRCVHCNDSTVIETVAKFCRDLTSLKVYHTAVTDNVNVLLRMNPNLQEVHIICVEEDEADYSIHNQNLSQLKLLSLYSSSSNDAKLINLVKGASSLLQLDLTFCEEITDQGMGRRCGNELANLRLLTCHNIATSQVRNFATLQYRFFVKLQSCDVALLRSCHVAKSI